MYSPKDGSTVNDAPIGGTGGIGIVKNATSRLQFMDPNVAVFLKDFMSSDWFNAIDGLSLAPPPGGGGGGGGGAGLDRRKWTESGSAGLVPMPTYHSLVTGSTFGSVVTPAAGGAGGLGSVVDRPFAWPSIIAAQGSGSVGGCGGGGGGSGGIIFISARTLFISSSAYLIASGGNGGNGASGWNGLIGAPGGDGIEGSAGGGGGGGGGGAGGVIIAFSQTSSTGAGFTPISDPARFNVRGGTGGIKGTGFVGTTGWAVPAADGSPGSNGPAGATYYIQI